MRPLLGSVKARGGAAADPYTPRAQHRSSAQQRRRPTFVPVGALGVVFNGALLAFDAGGGGGVHYAPLVEGETGWTAVECVGEAPHILGGSATAFAFLAHQRLYVVPAGPVMEGTCAAAFLTLDPQRRAWSSVRLACPAGWTAVPGVAVAVQPTASSGGCPLFHGGGCLFRIDAATLEITEIARTPATAALCDHMAFAHPDGVLLCGGRNGVAPNTAVWLLQLGDDDDEEDGDKATQEEIIGQLPPVSGAHSFPMLFASHQSRLLWFGPEVLTLDLAQGEAAVWTATTSKATRRKRGAQGAEEFAKGRSSSCRAVSGLARGFSQALCVVAPSSSCVYVVGGVEDGSCESDADDSSSAEFLLECRSSGAVIRHPLASEELLLRDAARPQLPQTSRCRHSNVAGAPDGVDGRGAAPAPRRDEQSAQLRKPCHAPAPPTSGAATARSSSRVSAFLPDVTHPGRGAWAQPFWRRAPGPAPPPSARGPQRPTPHVRAVSEHVLAKLVHSSGGGGGGSSEVAAALRKIHADSGTTTLSLVGMPVHCDGIFLVQRALAHAPHITTLDLSGHSFDRDESAMIVHTLRTAGLVSAAILDGTSFSPHEKVLKAIHEAVDNNRAVREQHAADEALRREKQRERRRQRREARRRQHEMRLALGRCQLELQAALAELQLARAEAHARVAVEQQCLWHEIALTAQTAVAEMEWRAQLRHEVCAQLATVELEETLMREAPTAAEQRARAELQRERQREWARIMERVREQKKQLRAEINVLRREATSARNAVKGEEKDEWDELWREWRLFRRAVEEVIAEREELDAKRRRWEMARAADRRALVDGEEAARATLEFQEQTALRGLYKNEQECQEAIRRRRLEVIRQQREAEAEARRQAEVRANVAERARQRAAMAADPPTMNVVGASDTRVVVLNDFIGVPLLVPAYTRGGHGNDAGTDAVALEVRAPMPEFMRSSTGMMNQHFEAGEISNTKWCERKATMLSAKLSVSLSAGARSSLPGGLCIAFETPRGWIGEGNPLGGGRALALADDPEKELAMYVISTSGECSDDGVGEKGQHQQGSDAYSGESDTPRGAAVHTITFSEPSPALIVAIAQGFVLEQRDVPLTVLQERLAVEFRLGVDFVHGEEGASDLVRSTLSFPVALAMTGPIVGLPESHQRAVFTEGDGCMSLFRGANVQGAASHQRFEGAQLSVYMHPHEDAADHFSFAAGGPLKLHGEGGCEVVLDSMVIARVVAKGILKEVPLQKGRAPPALAPNGDDACGAEKTIFTFTSEASDDTATALIRALQFWNISDDPVEGTRCMVVGLAFPGGLRAHTAVELEVVGTDDPTVIDFGLPSIPFRVSPAVPQQHQDFVEVSPCYFASACNVFDVDTTSFSGGHLQLALVGAKAREELRIVPLSGSPIELVDDDRTVLHAGQELASLRATAHRLHFQFSDSSSIAAVQALFKTFVFHSPETTPPPTVVPRVVEVEFVCGSAAPVRAQCQLKVTQPLVSIAVKDAFWTFREDSPLTPIANFSVCTEDDGWDGGFILVEYVVGHVATDDLLTIKQSNLVKLDEKEAALGGRRRSVRTGSNAGDQGRAGGNANSSSSGSFDNMAAAAAERPAAQSPRSVTDLKSIMRKKVRDKVRQLSAARRSALEELKERILEDVRNRRVGALISQREEKPVFVEGVRIGTVHLSPDSLMVSFLPYTGQDVTKPRVGQCVVKRSHVATLLRHIAYQNVSDHPTVLRKVLRVTASDGTPHTSVATVEIEVQPTDDATELRRLHHDPKLFRSQAPEDVKGFAFHSDVTLHDPDTFAFNGATLVVELFGGGDPKGDQLGFLTPAQQRAHGIKEEDLVSIVEPEEGRKSSALGGRLLLHGRIIGDLAVDEAGNTLRVQFSPMPAGATPPQSFDELKDRNDFISILVVERCLQSVTYTNVSAPSKVKQGQRVYQARVIVDGVEGRLKTTIDVLKPLLESPEFGAQLRYKEGTPPVACFPRLQINFSGEKSFLKKGHVQAQISANAEPTDVLSCCIPPKSEYALSKSSFLWGKEYVGTVTVNEGDKSLRLELDWASRATTKHLQQFGRFVSFSSTSNRPSTATRTITMEVRVKTDDYSAISTDISVLADDDPTEINLRLTTLEALRGGPPILLAAGADVADPDTDHFDAPSFLTVNVKPSGCVGDVLLLDGIPRPAQQSAVEVHLADISPGATEDPDRILARAVFDDYTTSLRLEFLDISLQQLQELVRRLAMRFEAGTGSRDKQSKRSVALSIVTGAAPAFRTTLSMNVLPPLLDMPPPAAGEAAVARIPGGVADLLPAVSVHHRHFSQGGVIRISWGAPNDGPVHPGSQAQRQLPCVSLRDASRCGVTQRENPHDGTLALSVDGRHAADANVSERGALQLTIVPHEHAGGAVQRILRCVILKAPTEGMAEDVEQVSVSAHDAAWKSEVSFTVAVK